AGQVERQIGNGDVFHQNAEQALVELVGKVEFLETPARSEPGARDQKHHGFAARRRFVQGALPAFAGNDPAVRIDVEERVLPALAFEPVAQRNGFDVVGAGMAQENSRHRQRPQGWGSRPKRVKGQTALVTNGVLDGMSLAGLPLSAKSMAHDWLPCPITATATRPGS